MATTHVVPKYGGVQIPVEVLHELVARVNAGDIPMVWNHDPRSRLNPTEVAAHVEERSDGHFAAVVEFDVDEEVWSQIDDELKSAGAPGGFSYSGTESRGQLGPRGAPSVLVAGECSHFLPQDMFESAAPLAEIAEVEIAELFQFGSTGEVARFVIEMGKDIYDSLPAELVGAAIYDLIRRSLQRKKTPGQTMVDVRLNETPGHRQLQAVVVTDDPAIAADALRTLLQSPPTATGILDYSENDGWVPPD